MRRLSLAVLAPVGDGDGGGGRGGAWGRALLQTGGVSFHAGAVGFKLDRINPLTNIKNLFSLRAAARLGKSLLPAGAAGRLCRAAHRAAVDHSAVFDRAPGDCWARMSTGCCWPPPGCSSAGRRSTTWWSGRAANRA